MENENPIVSINFSIKLVINDLLISTKLCDA